MNTPSPNQNAIITAVSESTGDMIDLLQKHVDDGFVLISRNDQCFKHFMLKHLKYTTRMVKC